jgi:hypothetical protein
MPSKPNYNHQRAERDRAKKASKEGKLRDKKEQAELRKSAQEGGAPVAAEGEAEAPSGVTPDATA